MQISNTIKINKADFINNCPKIKAKVHSIETFGAVDGPGIRFILFLQGCHLRCLYCHNPDSWELNAGNELSLKSILKNIMAYKKFYKNGGVTISGGEPLIQHQFLFEFLSALEVLGFHSAIDTNGFIDLKYSKKCIDKANMLLLDMKEVDENDCITLTEHSNTNMLKTLQYCQSVNKCVWIRYVCVPNYTLKDEKLHKLGKMIKNYSCVEKIDLIPFHQLGAYKYKELNIKYKLESTPTPSNEDMNNARAILKEYGF
ncbi:pyruvate formate-lyase-activating protein [Helicobacter sp. MIT 14-3879]|uniref:pyruvate formate-lyase-activating protein n=1 Tax=Helicobacter sp. MIT 14-3879 TaxID=2040649 RepID=UPI000E1EAF38|nr:pyruvate formate-lyase-activating protein [Helicobacter sp. MIT 14-3879]RDU64645.1 pyruvate formate lyase-activating protein [Helicobacter sp. MIT 14-3879]